MITSPPACWAAFDSDQSRILRASIDQLDAISAVGSGDAFLAGFVTARYIGLGDEPALKYAVACGAESTQHFGAGVVDRTAVDHLVDKVSIETVSLPVAG